MFIPSVKPYLLALQNTISDMLRLEDPDLILQEDTWEHAAGGGGITRAITGPIIEKAGVNFSHVKGEHLPETALLPHRKHLAGAAFEAMGVSSVIHPNNPFVPTTHLNLRFFQAQKENAAPVWWFGGGYDLTPYYPFIEDGIAWHQAAKAACDPFGEHYYPTYKKNCDAYFYLPHRKETRGIGGLFFDDLNEIDFDHCFRLAQSIADSFCQVYQKIVQKRKNMPYTDAHKDFQKYRRGRYVEFNLLYDRGTLFGLQTGGRTESILVSMPPEVVFRYAYSPELGTEEAELMEYLKPREWVETFTT